MSPPTLEVGRSVDLEVLADDGARTYPGRIEALGDTIQISLASEQMMPAVIARGVRVNIRIKAIEALFWLPALSLASWQGDVLMLEVAVVGGWRQVQRRADFRLEVDIAVEAAWLLDAGAVSRQRFDPWAAEKRKEPLINARLRQISAGGAQVEADTQMLPGDLMELKFGLGNGWPTIQTKARVVRIVSDRRKESRSSLVGVQFIGMKSQHENAVRRFVFSQQSSLRRKRVM